MCLAVSTEYRRVNGVTDGRTDILRRHSPRYAQQRAVKTGGSTSMPQSLRRPTIHARQLELLRLASSCSSSCIPSAAYSVTISVAVRLSLRASDGRSIASAFVITVVDLDIDEPDYGSDVVGRSVLLLRRNAFR